MFILLMAFSTLVGRMSSPVMTCCIYRCTSSDKVERCIEGADKREGGGRGRVVEYSHFLTLPHKSHAEVEAGRGSEAEAGVARRGGEEEGGETGRGWVVASEAGKGKSTLARDVAKSWYSGNLRAFKALFILNGFELSEHEIWEVLKSQIPNSLSRWGGSEVAEWMEETPFLLIIDDFIPQLSAVELVKSMEEWKRASILLLTIPSEASECHRLLSSHLSTIQFNMEDLNMSDILHLCTRYLSVNQLDTFRDWLTVNDAFRSEVMSYGSLVQPVCEAWKHGLISPTTTTTLTEIMWGLVESRLYASGLIVGVALLEKWISILGKICRRNLETRRLLNKYELEREAKKLFPPELLDRVVCSLFPTSVSAASSSVLSLPHSLTQFLAGWDVLTQNLRGASLKSLTKRITDEDPVVIYAAGHLNRFLQCQPDCPEKQIMRVAKNLILHMDRAKDRLGYILRVMHELKLHPKILQVIRKEVDLSKHWNINDSAILLHPIRYFLENATPEKALISLEKNCSAPDLPDVVSLFSAAGVPLFMADMNHLTWESKNTSDHLLKIIHRGTGQLEDFIGCLSSKTISSLGKFETTRNIVCLRVRVRDVESVCAVLKCPEDLPSLMWLEVDFDMAVSEVVKLQVPQVNTPLMDVSFKDVTDKDVPNLCEFLSRLRMKFSGIHMMRSKVTPQGARDLLKYFYRKRMSTTVASSVINKYRRWRFAILSHIDPTEELTEENALHLIGYDDRNHYSDNEIRSSVFTSRLEANTLANFFGALKDLVFFRYVCANFSVVKNTDGSTEYDELV